MMQSMSDKVKGWVAGILIGLIGFSFVFFGVASYMQSHGAHGDVAATVGKDKITTQTLQTQLMNAQMNPQFSSLPRKELQQQILGYLINNVLANQAATKLGLVTTSDQAYAVITTTPEFQQNGSFSAKLFQQYLQQRNMTADDYQRMIEGQMLQNQLAGVFSVAYVPKALLTALAKLQVQTRDIAYVQIKTQNFMASVAAPSSAAINSYYAAHKQDFKQSERVKLSYIQVTPAYLAQHVRVTPAQVQQYYNDNKSSYKTMPKWQLVKLVTPYTGAQGGAAYKTAAAKLQAFAAKADKSSVATLTAAAKRAGLQVSAAKWVNAAQAQDLPVLAALHKHDLSQAIVKGNNLEMLYVADLQPAQQKSFATVKNSIAKNLRAQKASNKMSAMSDQLSDLTYTNSGTLSVAASKLGLQVQTTGWLDKGEQTANLTGVLASPKVRSAAFSADVMGSGYNSNVIALADGSLVVVRLAQHQQSQLLPLAKVKSQIVANIKLAAAQKNMQKFILQLQSNLRSGNMSAVLLKTKSLSWKVRNEVKVGSKGVPIAVSRQAFLLRPAVAPAISLSVGTPDANGALYLVAVKAVHNSSQKLTAAQLQAMQQQVVQQSVATMLSLYSQHQRNNTKITIAKS